MRRWLALGLCLILAGLLVLPVYGATYEASEVTTEILVDSSGLCTVQTAVVLNVPRGLEEIQLPLPENAAKITVMGYAFKRSQGDGCTLLRITPAAAGEQTLRLSYTLPRAAEETDKGQALVLQLLPPGWDCTVAQYRLTLTMPEPWEAQPEFVSTFYGDLAYNHIAFEVQDQVLTVTSLQQIEDHDALTMTLDLPEGYFRLTHLSGKTAPWAILSFWLLVLACLVYWFFRLFLRPGPLHRSSMAPEGSSAGILHYQLTGGPVSPGLMILQWASLGYLTLEWQGRRLYLVRQIDMGAERKPYETRMFQRLFAEGDVCGTRSHRYRAAVQSLDQGVRSYWQRKLFSRRRSGSVTVLRLLGALAGAAGALCAMDRLVPSLTYRWALLLSLTLVGLLAAWLLQDAAQLPFRRKRLRGILTCAAGGLTLLAFGVLGNSLLLALVSVTLQLTVSFLALPGGRRTGPGRERFFSLLGLWWYLTRTGKDELQDLLDQDPQYYYRTLAVAEALGVGRSFTGKFNGYPLEPCDWLLPDGALPRTPEDFYPLFVRTLDLLEALTAAPSDSPKLRIPVPDRRKPSESEEI